MRLSDILVLTSGTALATSLAGHWFLMIPVTSSADGWGWDDWGTVPYVNTSGSSWIDNTSLSFQVWAFIVFNLTYAQAGKPLWGFYGDTPALPTVWDDWKLGAPSPAGLNYGVPGPIIGGYGELGPYAGRAFLALLFAGLFIRGFTSDYDIPLPSFA